MMPSFIQMSTAFGYIVFGCTELVLMAFRIFSFGLFCYGGIYASHALHGAAADPMRFNGTNCLLKVLCKVLRNSVSCLLCINFVECRPWWRPTKAVLLVYRGREGGGGPLGRVCAHVVFCDVVCTF